MDRKLGGKGWRYAVVAVWVLLLGYMLTVRLVVNPDYCVANNGDYYRTLIKHGINVPSIIGYYKHCGPLLQGHAMTTVEVAKALAKPRTADLALYLTQGLTWLSGQGLGLDLRILFGINASIYTAALALLFVSMVRMAGGVAGGLGIGIGLPLLLDKIVFVYLSSCYEEPGFILFYTVFVALLVAHRAGFTFFGGLAHLAFVASLLAKAQMAPVAVLAALAARTRREALFMAMVTVMALATSIYQQSRIGGSKISMPNSFLAGLVPASADTAGAIGWFGLSPTVYAPFVGIPYFYDDPVSPKIKDDLYEHVSMAGILGYYVAHPFAAANAMAMGSGLVAQNKLGGIYMDWPLRLAPTVWNDFLSLAHPYLLMVLLLAAGFVLRRIWASPAQPQVVQTWFVINVLLVPVLFFTTIWAEGFNELIKHNHLTFFCLCLALTTAPAVVGKIGKVDKVDKVDK